MDKIINYRDDHNWIIKVIRSCVTLIQLQNAEKLLPLFNRMYEEHVAILFLRMCRTDQLNARAAQTHKIYPNE